MAPSEVSHRSHFETIDARPRLRNLPDMALQATDDGAELTRNAMLA